MIDSEPFLQSRRERKKIETEFGDLKSNLGFTRLRLRGLTGARDEFLLAATVQNLRRLVKLVAIPPPSPQGGLIACAKSTSMSQLRKTAAAPRLGGSKMSALTKSGHRKTL